MGKTNTGVPERIKGLFRASSAPRATLSTIRPDLNPAHYHALVAWLPRINHRGRSAFSGQFPKRITRLKTEYVLEPVSESREIQWTVACILPHAQKINLFLNFALAYEKCLLIGEFAQAATLLAAMEDDLGISLWSIENRIFLLQTAYGLERHKGYVNSIREVAGDSLVSLLVFYASLRNEPKVNPLQFSRQMLDTADGWEIDQAYKSYLLFRIAAYFETGSQCAPILRHEATSSILDLYSTFIRLAEITISGGELAPEFRDGLLVLRNHIKDPRISKILMLDSSSQQLPSNLSIQQLEPYDLLVREDYASALKASREATAKDPMDVTVRFVSARALVELGSQDSNGSGIGDRIERLSRVLLARAETSIEDARLEMLRISLGSPYLGLSAQIEEFARAQFTSELTTANARARRSFINKPYLDPRDIRCLPISARGSYVKALLETSGITSGTVAELVRAGLDLSSYGARAVELCDGLGSATILAMKMQRAFESNDYESTLALAAQLRKEASLLYQRLASQYVANSLIALGRIAEATDFIATASMRDPMLITALPLERCAQKLDKTARRALAAKLSTTILLDLFSRHVSDRFDNIRAYAYEDFLLANGMERPSETAEKLDQFDREMLIYYLRWICIPEIMQVSTVFGGSRDLEEERLAVCAILTDLDKQNVELYEVEIREITRGQIIQAGVRHVDQSRIYVDLTAIRRWAEKNLKERFSRYSALLGAGIDAGASGFEEQLNKFLAGEPVPQNFLQLPKNEASELLVEILSQLLRECMTNPEHGLDCYLSMRIRHGALSGQLRGPLEEERIITQREGGSQVYKRNDYWMQRLYYVGRDRQDLLDARLSKFSHDFDNLVDEFLNEQIQVYSTNKRQGLFITAIEAVRLRALAADIKPDTSFDDFVTLSFELFWLIIERNLEVVRQTIDKDLKPKVNLLFTSLESDLEKLTVQTDTPDLDRAVRTAQTGAQIALNQVIEWFRLRRPATEPRFSFDQMIDIGLQCVKNIHRNFAPRLEKTIGRMPLFFQLTLLSDIFFIVFDNIQKHSGLAQPQVQISASETPQSLKISVKSEVSDKANNLEAHTRVERIREAILGGAYQHQLRSEGGTGLIKLRKIIGPVSQEHRHLNFGFTDDGSFFVELEIPFREIQL